MSLLCEMNEKTGMVSVELPVEFVDDLVLVTLKRSREGIIEDMHNHYTTGTYLHPDDITQNQEMLHVLAKVIEYYGG